MIGADDVSKLTIGSLFSGIGGFEYVASLYGIEPVWASEIEEAPIRITKRHFPNMKHYGDITKMNGAEIEPVDIISGGSPCFPAGTMVLTKNGYVNIEDIKVGDIVLTHKNRWRKVTAVGNREAETIILKGNCTIETTRNHPIYCADIKNYYPQLGNGKRGNIKQLINVGQWIDAEQMDHRQWATPMSVESLDVPIEKRTQGGQKDFPEINSDFWYFVGRWLGDGWVRDTSRKERPNGEGNGGILLCDSSSKEQELINTVKPISEKFSIIHERTVTKIRFTSQLLSRWLVNNFGKGAINKHLPGFVFGLDESNRRMLLQGILDSDGYKKDEHSYKISSISKSLVLGIRLLAESLGYSTSISMCKRPPKHIIEGRIVNQHDTYTVALINNPNRHTGLPQDGHKWYLCRTVTSTNQTKTVYNLSVEEDESYIADSIVVHNCQDLSVAGKQGGINKKCPICNNILPVDFSDDACPKCGAEIEYTRSGLFMEQIRLIKEMRKATNDEFPKIIVWENVQGALSSNNGDDFNCVLSEFVGLLGEKLPTLRPEKWTNAGEIVADKGSLAWRLFDAQYWGVPQRRRRIYLVLDFTGQRAGEILFKSESLRRHTPQSEVPWKRTTQKTESSIGTTDSEFREVKPLAVATQQVNAEIMEDVSPTLTAANGTSGSNKAYVVLNDQGGSVMGVSENITGTLRAENHGHAPIVVDDNKEVYGICSMASNCMKSDNPDSGIYKADVSKTLDTSGTNPTCNQGGNVVVEPVYCIQGNCIDRADTAGCNGKGWKEDVAYTLTTIDRPAVAYAVNENGDAAVWLSDHAQALTTGGGKPGQGYSAVLVETNNTQCGAFLGKQSESARGIGYDEKVSPTLVAGEPPQVAVYDQPPKNETLVAGFAYQVGPNNPHFPYNEEKTPTLVANQQMGVLIDNHGQDCRWKECKDGVCPTLAANMGMGGNNMPLYVDDRAISSTVGCFMHQDEEVAQCLAARDYKDPQIVYKKSIVRRLTPTECERLQGFPDDWTSEESDTARYKALGNSVALPCVNYVMSGIVDVLDPID